MTTPTLPLPAKRGLSVAEAAEYMGLPRDAFLGLVEGGELPKPYLERSMGKRGLKRLWDRVALDDYLDAIRGVTPQSAGNEDKAAWEDWRRDKGSGARHDA